MRKRVMIMSFLCTALFAHRTQAQDFEIQQLLLNVEKLAQLKNMLEDLKQGYEIVFKGYTTIKDISQGNFQLHQVFLDELFMVSPAVHKYYKIQTITHNAVRLVKESRLALNQLSNFELLMEGELAYIRKVLNNLLNKSLGPLDALATVLTDGVLRMSDDERLSVIDQIDQELNEQRSFLQHFTNNAKLLLAQRAKERNDINWGRKIYGLNK